MSLKKNIALLCAVILLSLSACTRKSERAAAYNNEIIALQSEIIQKFHVLDSSFHTNDLKDIELAHLELRTGILKNQKRLKDKGLFLGDDQLYTAANGLFDFYQNIAEGEYNDLIVIFNRKDSVITQPTASRLMEIENTIHNQFERHDRSFIKEQQSFGEKYNLEIIAEM